MEEERAKELAIKILADTELYGNDYYEVEDYIIQILLGEEPKELELGRIGLKCLIRREIKDYVDREYGILLPDEEVEDLAEAILTDKVENPLNDNLLQTITNRYMLERKMTIQGQRLNLKGKVR